MGIFPQGSFQNYPMVEGVNIVTKLNLLPFYCEKRGRFSRNGQMPSKYTYKSVSLFTTNELSVISVLGSETVCEKGRSPARCIFLVKIVAPTTMSHVLNALSHHTFHMHFRVLIEFYSLRGYFYTYKHCIRNFSFVFVYKFYFDWVTFSGKMCNPLPR